MGVYFAPQRRNYLVEGLLGIGQKLAENVITGMFERDKSAREQRQWNKGVNSAADEYWGGKPTGPMAQVNIESKVPVQSDSQTGQGLFSQGITVPDGILNQSVKPQRSSAERAFRSAGFLPYSQQDKYQNLMKMTMADEVKNDIDLANGLRIQQMMGEIPDITNRQAWAQYFAKAAPFLSDAKANTLSGVQQHLTPDQQVKTLDLGDRQTVVSFDPYSGIATNAMTQGINISPDQLSNERIAQGNNETRKYVVEKGLEGAKVRGQSKTSSDGSKNFRVDKILSAVAPYMDAASGRVIPGKETEAADVLSKIVGYTPKEWIPALSDGNTLRFNLTLLLESMARQSKGL